MSFSNVLMFPDVATADIDKALAAFEATFDVCVGMVHFQKLDGSDRSLFITRSASVIESIVGAANTNKSRDGQHKAREVKTDLVHVFDMAAKSWKSFHFAKVYGWSVSPRVTISEMLRQG